MIRTYHRPSQHIVLNQHPDQLLEAQPKKNFSLAFNPGWELHHACFFGIKSFSPADCKEILLKDKVTKYLIQKFFKFLWPLLHKKFNIWHVSVKIRKKRPCLSSSSQTKGQLVGTIGCLWWKFIVMVNFRHEHSIVLTSCPWVSEDGLSPIMGVYFI